MGKEKAKRFTDLIVWQKAHKFVLSVYRFTSGFPKEEIYGLTSQLRRAAVSIAANIVEGFKKTGVADKIRFLNISQGSLEECRYYLILVNDLGYGKTDVLAEQIDEVAKILAAYSKAIKRNK
jgi:four helix bundle protein